ncbi:MAG: glycosyltransferase family 2 protein [Patescibacteria group bacterium]
MKNFSIALAVYNEEENLERCLTSVVGLADEVIVVDGGSTDRTAEIAREFNAKVIKTDNPPIFHINKQKAISACTGEWILQLDADEVVSGELHKEIAHIISSNSEFAGYFIARRNYFLGHWLRKGGQYPDYVIRLLRRGKGRFPCKSVHEQIIIEGPIGQLRTPLLHYSYRTLAEYWKKADAYTTLTAQEMMKSKVPKNIVSWVRYEWIKPTITFLSLFLRHKGFMDGIYGLLFAVFSALHHPIAYNKFLRLK